MGYEVKQWSASDHERIYVTRNLSGGRTQDMGYIRIDDESQEIRYCLTRNKALVRDAIVKSLTCL